MPPSESISILQRDTEGARVLVVDDIEINRDLARSVLTSLGHVAEVAASGREAVSYLMAKAYDLVFMDIQMPEMDGIQTTLRIRELPDPARTVPTVRKR